MSRYAAARPKRAGETFARAHHGEHTEGDGPASSKKVKFDVRNPSALAPDTGNDDGEDDQVLAADVIGGGARATKRGAVNIDGYDSDSDNENFNARAEDREKQGGGEEVQFADVMDNYNSKDKGKGKASADDDEEVDMFAESDGDEGKKDTSGKPGRKNKEVRFLQDIEGQEENSKSGGTVRLDEEESSDDEEDLALAIEEEGLDEEVGLGGLKRNAPKIDAFNMRDEQQEGAFDEAGNYIRKAVDPDAVHDRWLEGVSKKAIKKAAAAQEKRDAELRQQQRADDSILTSDLLKTLILRLDRGETALEALARLGKSQTKPKKVPKWKQKKRKNGEEAADVDMQESDDPKQAKIKEAIDAITEAADKLLNRDNPTIYEIEREMLIREYRAETGEAWVEPPAPVVDESEEAPKMWEFRWTDGRDGAAKQGPYDSTTMKAWQDAGYFGEGVEFRPVGESGWSKVAIFI